MAFENMQGDSARSLRSGVSFIALCAFAAATPAVAQTTTTGGSVSNTTSPTQPDTTAANSTSPAATPGERNAIVVTGIRQSLRSAQNIKRNSDTVEDVITAQDIGALPDRSVTEALQRVPGVAMNRFAAVSDPDHFSAEGSGIVIRGLTFTRSEFNGRDTFSTGVYGQAINFQDVPAELLGSVEVFKEGTADRIEGGLSGTVNMNLRLPFDSKGLHIGYDLEADYGDLRKKWSPVGSLLISDTWDTGIGRIGILAAGSYSRIFTQADAIQVSNFQTRDGLNAQQTATAGTGTCRNQLPNNADTQGFPTRITNPALGAPCYGAAPAGANGYADWADVRYAPIGGQFRRQQFDRKRRGFAGGLQWQSNDRRALLTAQFLNSRATEDWNEHVFQTGSDLSNYNTFPIGCLPNSLGQNSSPIAECPNGKFTNYTYDSNGVFQNGYITLPANGGTYRGNNLYSSTNPTGYVGDRVPGGGEQATLDRRFVHDVNVVQDQSLNFKFSPTPHWDINLDGQYVKAKHDNLDMTMVGSNYVDQELDLTGTYPIAVFHKPTSLANNYTWSGTNKNVSPALASATDAQYFNDPRYTFWRSAMDHIEHSKGFEWAAKGDIAYNFLDQDGFLKQLKFGGRYADRTQHIKSTTYNWGSLSENWTSAGGVYMDQLGGSNVETYTFNNFFRGDTAAPPPGHYYSGDLINGYDQAVAFAKLVEAKGQNTSGGWKPLAERAGVVAGTPFLPSEMQDVGQKTTDAYAMLRFGSPNPIFGNVRLDGNIGVRFVHDKLNSLGSIGVPTATSLGLAFDYNGQTYLIPYLTNPTFLDPNPASPTFGQPVVGRCQPAVPTGAPAGTPAQPRHGLCDTLDATAYAQLQQWATGITSPDNAVNKYSYWLPSVNLKFGLSRDLVFRLSASRDFARPGLGDIRNFLQVGLDANGNPNASAGNPFLRPITSDNFDATLEWYFAGSRVGSLIVDGFVKNIHNYVYSSIINRDITSNGITETVAVRGPANFTGTGKVRGLEIAYTQTYDFLPGFLSGLGLSANYTYVTSKGVPNSYLNSGSAVSNFVNNGTLPLAQLSKHTFNIAPFFEKGPISVRLAYNWRSKFLITEADVIYPYYPIWNAATGTLDASVFYTIAPQLKVGIQAQNLTNEVTETLQQFSSTGLLGPRSYFMNDRRFAFIVRGAFGGSTAHAAPPPPPIAPPPPAPAPVATQTCADGTVIEATATCPAPPPPPPPPAAKPERG